MANKLMFKHLRDAYAILKANGYSVSGFDEDSKFIKAESKQDILHLEYNSENIIIVVC